ncbi:MULTISPECIES: VOC family protein [Ramlibacter]|uniref:VOC family protein n=1 Tax=Ramlibacter pinisoli TaxID=2682844 RepID=A0A6N8IUM5_9BURK|nr:MULTISPECIES: VOC family protein [Ramlibacter]MBA2964741.1 VOC family protein [Ramlibacter sp. CGMCC 1.13660]MVQ29706.1 VOC family protein [Ramlibacter pinisoli]
MPQTSTCLWFDNQAREAADFYVALFPNSRITAVTHYGPGAPMPEGSVLTVTFELDGRSYTGLNGGPVFKLSPAVSIVVHCRTQDEVDHYWNALSAVPQAEQCGWVCDRFGVSWQIVPEQLFDLLQDPDAARRQRVMSALMGMKKLDLRALQAAAR